jgi:integrase
VDPRFEADLLLGGSGRRELDVEDRLLGMLGARELQRVDPTAGHELNQAPLGELAGRTGETRHTVPHYGDTIGKVKHLTQPVAHVDDPHSAVALFQASSYQADEDLVFGHPHSGRPLDRSLLLKRFKAALARAGVREIRFHDLRHTFGTRIAAAGVPMRTLQEWMGHRDFKTTLIYADYAPSANEAEIVNGAFAPGLSTNLSTNLSESGSNANQEEPGNLN